MEVAFSQIYIEPGVSFTFSWQFQKAITAFATSTVEISAKFMGKYGINFKLIFNVSAKQQIKENEVRGPSVFRRTKDVEYTIFLPFDECQREKEPNRAALKFLFAGVCQVLDSLDIQTASLVAEEGAFIERVLADPSMFKR